MERASHKFKQPQNDEIKRIATGEREERINQSWRRMVIGMHSRYM
jgi:hypothetical protein